MTDRTSTAGGRVVTEDLDGARVDVAVAALFELATLAARRLCADGRVRRNGRKADKGDRVEGGDVLAIIGGEAWFVVAGAPPLSVLSSSPSYVVVDKPAGVPCHPLTPGEGGTVADAIAGEFVDAVGASVNEREAGLLHRLDTGTSGCLAFARSRAAWTAGRLAIDDAEKTYLALVEGAAEDVVVDAPIGHDGDHMRVDPAGRAARTQVRVRGSAGGLSLVELGLSGGRRHQLRVHLAHLGHPLVGDVVYGGHVSGDGDGFFLHAWRLRFTALGSVVDVTAPLPSAFAAALARAGLSLR